MGVVHSIKKWTIPSKVSNRKCNCSLYFFYHHCCQNQCFPEIKNVETFISIPGERDEQKWSYNNHHQQSLTTAVSNLNLTVPSDLIAAIFSYLCTTPQGYFAYCHGAINNHIDSNRLCKIWCKHFFGDGDNTREIKLVALGHGGAGKSSLIIRFVARQFVDEYDPTIEDSYRKKLEIYDGKCVLLDILDTAGQEEFSSMQDRWIREAQISLLCFGIDTKNALDHCIESFDKNLRCWDMSDDDHFGRNGLVLVGCKMDLMYNMDGDCDEMEKQIMQENYDTAQKLSKIWNIPFIETSALEEMNVNLLFRQTIIEYWIQTQTRSVNFDATEHQQLLSTI